jgi:hypothetical protein
LVQLSSLSEIVWLKQEVLPLKQARAGSFLWVHPEKIVVSIVPKRIMVFVLVIFFL